MFDQPSPVTTPCPLTLRLGFSLVRSISLKSSTPFLKEALISPCLLSSVKFCITSAFDDGGERGKASKSGKKLKDVVDDFLRFATWPSVGVENLFQIKQNGYRSICVLFRPCDFAGRTEQQSTLREFSSLGIIVIPMLTTSQILATGNLTSDQAFLSSRGKQRRGTKRTLERNDIYRRKHS